MRNEQNLTKYQFKAGEERTKACGRKGRKKAQENRRRALDIDAVIRRGLKMPLKPGELSSIEDIQSLAEINGKNLTVSEAIGVQMLYNAMHNDKASMIYLLEHYSETGGSNAEDEARVAAANRLFWANIGPAFAQAAGDIIKHNHTHYDLSGGRGSLKSSFVSLIVIYLLINTPDVHAVVFRKVGNTLKDSVFSQYQWAIDRLGMNDSFKVKKSPPEITYKPTGQMILFRGADDPGKIKSIKLPFGYIAITHFEEKDQFAGRPEIRNILQSTMRGGDIFWNFESYNPPISRDNWANKDSLEDRPDRFRLKTTYLDVPVAWLGEQFIAEAEHLKEADENTYNHEYMGEAVGTGGNVFTNMELREISDEEISRFDHIFMGNDWGWYPDPFAFIRVHYDRTRETIYFIDEIYENKISNEEAANRIKEKGYTDTIVTSDSAEPKSCADFRSCGVPSREAVKGPGSVEYGMKWLQKRKLVIDRRRTPHAYEEFTEYEYERNKDGEIISGYPDKNNHLIDALRYAMERESRKFGARA